MELSHLALVLLLQVLVMGLVNTTFHKPTCPDRCGNVTIPYPFGTQEGCFLDSSYYIECNSTTQIPSLRVSYSLAFPASVTFVHLEVLEVKIDGQIRVSLPISYGCFTKHGKLISGTITLVSTPRFPFSSTLNWLTGVGCGIQTHVLLNDPLVDIKCPSNCVDYARIKNGSCLGNGCCRATISQGMTTSRTLVTSLNERVDKSYCGYAFIVQKDKYFFDTNDLVNMNNNMSFPAVLDWSVGETNCEEAQKGNATYICPKNSICDDGEDGLLGCRCKCSHGYWGNPYIANGCEDINECEFAELNDCLPGHCINTDGGYTCVCSAGLQGNARTGGPCATHEHKSENYRSVIEGIIEGVIGAAVAMSFVYWVVKKKKIIKGRKDFFKQNGGIMLQKSLFTCKDPVNKAKIFTEEELKKATDNFNKANVIGQGGYGTVYRGILANKTTVAIKKSKVIDQSQIKQFVNEVIMLSQINHPNIVKLLGCCLETHVPLLVYEYITNNTLGHHIHMVAMLTFQKRLKIAAETAEALAYMHSTTQIIHRDVKPSNILLNDEFVAKVSDFGISRFVPVGQTHLSTSVKGTIGYVDPEYFRTCKLTEKSDVYGFGVVLIELLTGTTIHSLELSLRFYEGAAAYLASLLERDALVQVLDDQLKKDEYFEVVKCVANIAINCLHLDGTTRPTMKEVTQELKQLRCLLFSIEAESI